MRSIQVGPGKLASGLEPWGRQESPASAPQPPGRDGTGREPEGGLTRRQGLWPWWEPLPLQGDAVMPV